MERYVSRNDQEDEKLKYMWKGLKIYGGINVEHGSKADIARGLKY